MPYEGGAAVFARHESSRSGYRIDIRNLDSVQVTANSLHTIESRTCGPIELQLTKDLRTIDQAGCIVCWILGSQLFTLESYCDRSGIVLAES